MHIYLCIYVCIHVCIHEMVYVIISLVDCNTSNEVSLEKHIDSYTYMYV